MSGTRSARWDIYLKVRISSKLGSISCIITNTLDLTRSGKRAKGSVLGGQRGGDKRFIRDEIDFLALRKAFCWQPCWLMRQTWRQRQREWSLSYLRRESRKAFCRLTRCRVVGAVVPLYSTTPCVMGWEELLAVISCLISASDCTNRRRLGVLFCLSRGHFWSRVKKPWDYIEVRAEQSLLVGIHGALAQVMTASTPAASIVSAVLINDAGRSHSRHSQQQHGTMMKGSSCWCMPLLGLWWDNVGECGLKPSTTWWCWARRWSQVRSCIE